MLAAFLPLLLSADIQAHTPVQIGPEFETIDLQPYLQLVLMEDFRQPPVSVSHWPSRDQVSLPST